tara:strand:- start:125 stop:508 length:384 start_codon:yes stop_codon:yes gene_type:complete
MPSESAEAIILGKEIPILSNAFISLLLERRLYASNVDIRTAIGKDITRKPGSLKKRTWIAIETESPDSTICRISSNIAPKEREIIVNADTEKRNGGNNSAKSHLSRRGIRCHLALNRPKYLNRKVGK